MSTRLRTGASAPGLHLPDHRGGSIALAEHHGRRVIVAFVPELDSAASRMELADFRQNWPLLQAAGFQVLVVAADAPSALAVFRLEQGLSFPLLSDADGHVARAWGAWGPRRRPGGPAEGVVRSTFIVDGRGRLLLAEYGVDPLGHVARLRAALGG